MFDRERLSATSMRVSRSQMARLSAVGRSTGPVKNSSDRVSSLSAMGLVYVAPTASSSRLSGRRPARVAAQGARRCGQTPIPFTTDGSALASGT